MKLLLFYSHSFWIKPYSKTLEEVPDCNEETQSQGVIVAFVHAEEKDEDNLSKVVTKAIKNIKWLAGKFTTKNVILHSFAHLATSKASPEFAQSVVSKMKDRLISSGCQVQITPFGYFTEFKIHVAGQSLAKVFVEI
ncbi:MAG: threonyl-tRNA synthetase editing domain-containing protein [bacterium]